MTIILGWFSARDRRVPRLYSLPTMESGPIAIVVAVVAMEMAGGAVVVVAMVLRSRPKSQNTAVVAVKTWRLLRLLPSRWHQDSDFDSE